MKTTPALIIVVALLAALPACKTVERAARHELERKVVTAVQGELDVFIERKLLALMQDKLPHGLGGVIMLMVGKWGLGKMKKKREEKEAV